MGNQRRAGAARWLLLLLSVIGIATPYGVAERATAPSVHANTQWETKARLHRTFKRDDRGTLLIDDRTMTFESESGRKQSWAFLDIQTVLIDPHHITVQTYVSRIAGGDKEVRFDLAEAVPPGIAASITKSLHRPSQNAVPDLQSPEIGTIHARHRRLNRGTNGVLRFRNDGIDYVTNVSGDSRSWRWADLQTISVPDPYHLLVFGYRDNYTFDLKEPVPAALIDNVSKNIFEASRNSGLTLPIEEAK